ncbi:MAG: DNA gyrase subunit A, partial [Lachnospiraceae bacterium]|nr:DNA gyrase subunit A [Lachnospiraceae bacterium]
LQSKDGMFLKFTMDEVPLLKKNTRGVRGMKLEKNDTLEQVYLPGTETIIMYKEKEVHLNRLKLAKRDGKGSKRS